MTGVQTCALPISEDQRKEIVATVTSKSWRIWRPVLYVIGRSSVIPIDRIKSVPHHRRAAYGPELQILDLKLPEFDLIEPRR